MPRTPVWRAIATTLIDEIGQGRYVPGDKLPTEAELSRRFGVNRHTLRRAMAALAEDGLVRIEQGRGTYVQENVVDYMIGRRTRFSEIITRQHRHPGGRLLQAQELPASAEVAEALELPVDTPCLCLESLGEVDGQPLSLSVSHFPAARFPDLIAIVAETGSVTKAMEHHGVGDYQRKVTRVTARLPDAEEAALLQQPRVRPVLVLESINVDSSGTPVQYGLSRFAADRTQLVFET